MTSKTASSWLTPSFVASFASMRPSIGAQISWADVGASFIDANTTKKRLPAGTVIGRIKNTGATLGKWAPHGAAALAGAIPATEYAILQTSADEDPETVGGFNGYGTWVGGVVYENLLPDATGTTPAKNLPAGMKTSLASAGCTFVYTQREVSYS
jgi:hypothetical protein